MGRTFAVAFVALLYLVAHCVHPGFVFGCHVTEWVALFNFKHSFTDTYGVLPSWKGIDCCLWDGVTCSNVTGHVNRLDLSSKTYTVFPVGWSPTAYKLDPTLIELKHLKHLILRGMDFQGSQIPGFIGSFKHLRYLDLSYSNFSAVLPPQLGNLTRLQHLGLSGQVDQSYPEHKDMNDVTISNTRNTMQVLANLASLTYLQLRSRRLVSTPHFYTLLSNSTWLHRIETLDLSDNMLTGPLPNVFANMTSLKYLDLSRNLLNGAIPLWLRNVRKLEHLYLFLNSFSRVEGGVILAILESCPRLRTLDLCYNSLEGVLGGPHKNFSKGVKTELVELELYSNKITGNLPFWLGEFKRLELLDIGSNKISSNIPASIGNLSDLGYLDLSNNSLDGVIPKAFGQLDNLYSMDLSSNGLEGVVSASNLANLSSLRTLRLGDNLLNLNLSSDWKPPFQLSELNLGSCKIGAQLPHWIKSYTLIEVLDLSNTDIFGESLHFLCQFTRLKSVDLRGNKFFGTIPDCLSLNNNISLELIDFSLNKLSGPIPRSIGQIENLNLLYLNNNSLEGEIPQTLSSFFDLIIMDLGENNLSGRMPDWGQNNFLSLEFLRMRSNKLVGPIPEYLCSLPSIQLLDLANNYLTGTIPPCIGDINEMSINITSNSKELATLYRESAVEVLKGDELQYTSNLKFLVDFDLSCNELVGLIPESIAKLTRLNGFNLSHNNLTGGIPRKIGEMRSLESLDLSNNRLYGTIPSSLSAITSLSSLNLSNNQLHGQIPTGTQLQTFNDPSIYAGNKGLCGDPLPNKCKPAYGQQQQQESIKEDAREKILLYFVIFSGFATGFWGFVGSLLLKRRFRFALFHIFSNISDYFYVQTMVRINRLRN